MTKTITILKGDFFCESQLKISKKEKQMIFTAELACIKYFCYISLTKDSTRTDKFALLSGIGCRSSHSGFDFIRDFDLILSFTDNR